MYAGAVAFDRLAIADWMVLYALFAPTRRVSDGHPDSGSALGD